MIRVTVWNEFVHEKESPSAAAAYPDGIHNCIASFLGDENIKVTTATLDMPMHGLTDELLENTDVLIWWGHIRHKVVCDEVVEKVCERVLKGMGFIALHSAHHSKPFKKLMGTTCNLSWRDGAYERIWCISPTHPIAAGIPEQFVLENEEMYGEYFDIPKPDDVVFSGWYKSGEVFRSGCTFTRGYGKIFYFQPGHEAYPTFHNEYVQKIIKNAVLWAVPQKELKLPECNRTVPLE